MRWYESEILLDRNTAAQLHLCLQHEEAMLVAAAAAAAAAIARSFHYRIYITNPGCFVLPESRIAMNPCSSALLHGRENCNCKLLVKALHTMHPRSGMHPSSGMHPCSGMRPANGLGRLYGQLSRLPVSQAQRSQSSPPAGSCEQKQGHQRGHEPPDPARIVQVFFASTAAAAASSILAQPAGAWGHTWRPRRHHRRLDEWQREPDLRKYSKVCVCWSSRVQTCAGLSCPRPFTYISLHCLAGGAESPGTTEAGSNSRGNC